VAFLVSALLLLSMLLDDLLALMLELLLIDDLPFVDLEVVSGR
jgi:hypothetical protein